MPSRNNSALGEGSPRRRLELDDENSQSIPFAFDSTTAMQYDASDHTAHSSGPTVHVMAIPRALLSTDPHAIPPDGSCPRGQQQQQQQQWNSPAAAALTGASPGPGAAMAEPFVAALRDGCSVVRLPHPRHGEAALFLCPPRAALSPPADPALPVLYELQAQKPPGGFGQTWFINDSVEPNEDLIIVTPIDVTFFALRQAFTHAMRDKFISAEDLFFDASCGAKRGGPEWPGWGVALAQCAGLAPALAAMQSHEVLSRICEAKCVGGDSYYRFSEERAGAWMREKMQRVSNCPALRALLQLGGDSGSGSGSGSGDVGTTAPQSVPTSVAFGVVSEYIVEEWIKAAAQLCGTDGGGGGGDAGSG